ncbi:hypothetical protein M427DRAFT_53847 [Gonapodya prolifera JEL478]|uniref:Uncharacterized protein n=1 Tax=Gonapodya prolifera (strain JEL478) TaxID=1344416 RepID=A0A139AP00_GONPJ|nr:hypothetical protein M427DRAFT_53847 [Gonapodya prolifera JEL478]|eukprot:KXS18470.1 hypothetical protein M427DRAFT_53847 [Gonapodya prolifera JEL478]
MVDYCSPDPAEDRAATSGKGRALFGEREGMSPSLPCRPRRLAEGALLMQNDAILRVGREGWSL